MSSAFVASQSSCSFLGSREQIRLAENKLYSFKHHNCSGSILEKSYTMYVLLLFAVPEE
jgi:hypothetical protein